MEPCQGPDIPIAGRGLGQREDLGRLAVAQLLEVPQYDDLAVDRIHAVERLLEPEPLLGPDGRLAGGGAAVQELGRHRRGAGGVRRSRVERDLPPGVVTKDLCGGQLEGTIGHGTAMAEVVHEMAPEARLYLVCVDSEVALGEAMEYARDEGVDVIAHGLGWFNTSRGDGRGGPATPEAPSDAAAPGETAAPAEADKPAFDPVKYALRNVFKVPGI